MTSDATTIQEPAISPLTIRFLVVGHFTFAVVVLAFAFVNGAVENGSVEQGLMKTLTAVDTQQALALKKTLQRTSDVKAGLNKFVAGRLPSSVWVNPLAQTVDIGLALLLVAAGTCLLQRHPLGRPLSLGFAAVCLTQKLGLIVYQMSGEIPLAKKYFEALFRMYPADTDLFNGILGPITNGPVYLMVVAVYPVIVLAVMLRPGAQAALTQSVNKTEQEPELPATQIVALQMSVLQPVEDDPLAALMQRKTF
jgi:hypothetical protein